MKPAACPRNSTPRPAARSPASWVADPDQAKSSLGGGCKKAWLPGELAAWRAPESPLNNRFARLALPFALRLFIAKPGQPTYQDESRQRIAQILPPCHLHQRGQRAAADLLKHCR